MEPPEVRCSILNFHWGCLSTSSLKLHWNPLEAHSVSTFLLLRMHCKTGITKTVLEMLHTKLSFPSACLHCQRFRDKPQLQHSQSTVSCFFTPATSHEYLQLFFSVAEGSEGPRTARSRTPINEGHSQCRCWILIGFGGLGAIGEKLEFALANDCGTEQ